MKHKTTKWLSTTKKEKEKVSVFILTADFRKFKKGEIFEEFYQGPADFYAVSSNLFKSTTSSGHTKIIPSKLTKIAPVSFFKSIRKEDSMLYRLHNEGLNDLRPVEYHKM